MVQDIPLQELIEKVKEELLTPPDKPGNPLFFVEKAELELKVIVTREAKGGIKLSVLSMGSIEAGGRAINHQWQTVKVILTPIMTVEEQRKLVQADGKLWQEVEQATTTALRKGNSGLAGEPE